MTRDDILREAMGTVLDEIPRAAQQARDDERAAVVAWLRAAADFNVDTSGWHMEEHHREIFVSICAAAFRHVASCIEDGTHTAWRKEEP